MMCKYLPRNHLIITVELLPLLPTFQNDKKKQGFHVRDTLYVCSLFKLSLLAHKGEAYFCLIQNNFWIKRQTYMLYLTKRNHVICQVA